MSVILSLYQQHKYMIRTFAVAMSAVTILASCASHSGPYQPATRPEKIEFAHDRLDVYPDDVRKAPATLLGTPVVWAGVILNSDAHEMDQGGKIMVDSTFEHHYFDWVQDTKDGDLMLSVSPRGEGRFKARWYLDRTIYGVSAHHAEKFAKPGRLALFYGVPEKIDPDGTVVLKYHYLRMIGMDHFTTNDFNYGRLGEEPMCASCLMCKTNPPPVKTAKSATTR